jgi:formate dehydrogenase major subunit
VTASNRSIQWRERVISPLFESQTDHAIMYAFAKKFGWDKEFTTNYKIVKPDPNKMEEPEVESILREINKGTWTIGYTGQSPERLKLHMKNMNTFDETLVEGRPVRRRLLAAPPSHGSPELKHPGSLNHSTSVAMMDGGGCFRANFGVEREGVNPLPRTAGIQRRRPHHRAPGGRSHPDEEARFRDELTDDGAKAAEGKNREMDLRRNDPRLRKVHGNPFGNAKARAIVGISRRHSAAPSAHRRGRDMAPSSTHTIAVPCCRHAIQDDPAGERRRKFQRASRWS